MSDEQKAAPEETQTLAEKVDAFLTMHHRVVEDFKRSLGNARHFIELAQRAMEREPTETAQMLEEIRSYRLHEFLTEQYENFRHMAGFLEGAADSLERSDIPGECNELAESYEALLTESTAQEEIMDKLLSSLRNPH